MGCKSAKDRTISIVLGNSMLQTLLEKRLADGREIEKLFDQQGYFSCDSLTAKELMMLKDLLIFEFFISLTNLMLDCKVISTRMFYKIRFLKMSISFMNLARIP